MGVDIHRNGNASGGFCLRVLTKLKPNRGDTCKTSNAKHMKTTPSEYDTQAEQFLTSNGIKFRATLSDTKTPAWSDNGKHGHHYRVTLSKGNPAPARLTFDFWSSIKDAEDGIQTVTPYSVLACISGDTNTPETFADFCAEYGYEQDSIKALQTFRRCSAFSKRLRAFFTESEIEQLAEIQ